MKRENWEVYGKGSGRCQDGKQRWASPIWVRALAAPVPPSLPLALAGLLINVG